MVIDADVSCIFVSDVVVSDVIVSDGIVLLVMLCCC